MRSSSSCRGMAHSTIDSTEDEVRDAHQGRRARHLFGPGPQERRRGEEGDEPRNDDDLTIDSL